MNLYKNNLATNPDNFKYLTELIKHLPNNLQDFSLNLKENDLGEISLVHFNWLTDSIKQLPNNLLNMKLELSKNNLASNPENLTFLSKIMK